LTVSTPQLEQLRQQMLFAADDAEPLLQIGEWNAERYRGAMYLHRRQQFDAPPVLSLLWQGEAEITVPEWRGRLLFRPGYGLQAVSAAQLRSMPLQLRPRLGGERLRPAVKAANRQLKHLLQEAGIPPWRRQFLPLIWQKECLIAVPGLAVAVEFQALGAADGVEIIWEPSQA
jgi:tRNA(Ile)-lysidine synthase